MEIKFFQAQCGDAARIRFIGTDDTPHNIFIDSGYDNTFRETLLAEIESIQAAGECIDLWVISHIHDDHIGGAEEYIKGIINGEFTDIVEKWYYNPPRINNHLPITIMTPAISTPASISQGDNVTNYLQATGKLLSEDLTTQTSVLNLFGLQMTILSPNPTTLQRLKDKYPAESGIPLEREEDEAISSAKAACVEDYPTPLQDIKMTGWTQDKSVENGSSISLLTIYQGKSILWLADAFPSVVVTRLKEAGYSKENPLHCDWVKVAHHGSRGNNSDKLYELISCQHYLISADAENNHCLPTKECLVRILHNRQDATKSYHFHFTYDTPNLRSIFAVDGPDIFEKYNFEVHYPNANSNHVAG